MAQLRVVSDEYDQIAIMIYGSKTEANMIRRVIGTENTFETEPDSAILGMIGGLLDWILP